MSPLDHVKLDVDIVGLLRELGVDARRSGNELRGHCPHPAHARKPGPGSWQIQTGGKKAGLHHCYSCGFGGGSVALIAAVRGLSPREAWAWLLEFTGGGVPAETKVATWARKLPPAIGASLRFPRETHPLWTPDLAPELDAARDYLRGRGVTDAEINRYRLHAVPASERGYGGRVIVPVVVQGELVDFVARLYVERDRLVPKALSAKRSEGARKELVLWGYDDLDPTVPVVHVVEGVWGALWLRRAGVPNVTAICGSAWSPERTELLSAWPRVVLIPDGDAAGSKLEERATGLRFATEVLAVDLPPGLQPDTDPGVLDRIAHPRPARTGTPPVVSVTIANFEAKR